MDILIYAVLTIFIGTSYFFKAFFVCNIIFLLYYFIQFLFCTLNFIIIAPF